jgi:anaerobic nitric oxide reductase transcription regulator
MRALIEHDWPGNVRELEHTILRAALRAAGGRRRETVVIDAAALDLPRTRSAPVVAAVAIDMQVPLDQAVEDLKRRRIADAIDRCNGNWARAARHLGLDPANLHRMAKRLGMHD